MVEACPLHRPCWRLRAQMSVSPLSRLAEADDLDRLRDMIRRTTVAPMGSRFSSGSFRPLYAAFEQRTCLAEVVHHWSRTFLMAGCPAGMPLRTRMLNLGVDGERFLDVRIGHPDLHDPDAYDASQRFGMEAYLAGEDGILYRSVRDPDGTCVAVIRPAAAGPLREHGELRLLWLGDRFEAAS